MSCAAQSLIAAQTQFRRRTDDAENRTITFFQPDPRSYVARNSPNWGEDLSRLTPAQRRQRIEEGRAAIRARGGIGRDGDLDRGADMKYPCPCCGYLVFG